MKHTEYIIPIGEDAQDYDEMFIGVIRRQPKLVRCKDCDWYGIAELKQDGTVDMRYKPSWCFLWRSAMNADDYCSCSVRRTDETD